MSRSSAGTVVVIDSGLSSAWATGNLLYQKDFHDGDDDVMVAAADTHGALVTASLLATAPDVGVVALKVMPDDGSATDESRIEQALQWVVANADAYNVVAVNLSLGGGKETAPLHSALSDELAALAAKRVLTVAAAGNSGDGGASQDVSSFAADPNQICVSASTGEGEFPAWAQRSPTLTDLCADGTDIRLTDLSGQSYRANGSSFAAPTVTAAVALAQQRAVELTGERLTQDEFLALARSSGTAMGTSGYTEIDVDALLAEVARLPAQASGPAPAGAATTITVNAQGIAAGGVNARFTLLVDGRTVGEGRVGSTAEDYAFTVDAAPGTAHKVQIRYDNDAVIDGEDRNLTVNTVTINGKAVKPTDGIVTYDKGALDGKDVVTGQADLWWNGALVVDADQGFFPAAGEADGLDLYQHAVIQGLSGEAPPLEAGAAGWSAAGLEVPGFAAVADPLVEPPAHLDAA